MTEFYEQLRRARQAKGITQQSLADQLFVTRQAVSRWECGDRYPDLPTTKQISIILGISVDELLFGTGMCIALKCEDIDNVATIFANDVMDQDSVEIRDKMGGSEVLTVVGDIAYGCKIAIVNFMPGDKIMKYGECIGVAIKAIKKGEYVHLHNMTSLRGNVGLNK